MRNFACSLLYFFLQTGGEQSCESDDQNNERGSHDGRNVTPSESENRIDRRAKAECADGNEKAPGRYIDQERLQRSVRRGHRRNAGNKTVRQTQDDEYDREDRNRHL